MLSNFYPYMKLCQREFSFIFWKDRRRGILVLLAATVYMLLFGLLYNQGIVREIPVVVYDQSQSTLSREFVRTIDDSDAFYVKSEVSSQEDLTQYMGSNREFVTFQIPPDFAPKLRQGKHTEVLMNVDGSNILVAGASASGSVDLLRAFSEKQSIYNLEIINNQNKARAMQRIHPMEASYRIIGNSTQNYQFFFVLGLALAAFQQGIFLSVAASILHKNQGIMPEEHLMNPVLRLFCKLFPYWIVSLLSFALLMYVAESILGLPYSGASVFPLIALIGAFSFMLIMFTALVSSLLQSEVTFTRISVIYTIPAFMLSGFTWPLEAMPQFIRGLAYLFPLTYVATTFRAYYLMGHSPVILDYALGLFIVGLVFMCGAIWIYHKRINFYEGEQAET